MSKYHPVYCHEWFPSGRDSIPIQNVVQFVPLLLCNIQSPQAGFCPAEERVVKCGGGVGAGPAGGTGAVRGVGHGGDDQDGGVEEQQGQHEAVGWVGHGSGANTGFVLSSMFMRSY